MSTSQSALTEEDIETLVKGVNLEDRAIAAHKLCRSINRAELDSKDRERAHQILRIMAADAEELVRRALAVTLRASHVVPHDVALKLARDVESVALPMLNFSPVFTDEDLAEVIRLGDPVRQIAIAQRPALTEKLTAVLAEEAAEQAVEIACANDNAMFGERSLQRAIERFNKSERVLQAVAYRSVLPLAVTERLVGMVSDQLREHLVTAHAVTAETAFAIALGARERSTIDLVDQAGRAADIKLFTLHLHKTGRLSASLLLRALAHGHMAFVEHAIATLSGVPHHRTWLMVHDAGPLGLKAIYERAGLPSRLFAAFRAGIDTYHLLERQGGLSDKARFQERMLERFLTQPQPATREDMDYLLDKLDRARSEARRLGKTAA